MGHKCSVGEKCRYCWSGRWCAKIIRCPECGKKVHPYLKCPPRPSDCEHYKPKVWWYIAQWWRDAEEVARVKGEKYE